jgi:hypothetical protein
MQTFIRTIDDADTRTAFTEITIDAPPAKVRQKLLAFEEWHEWNPTIPKIIVKSGDLSDLISKPTLELELDLARSGNSRKVPALPVVTVNDANALKWGLNLGVIFQAEHIFLFEPIDGGKATRFVHYERMSGLLSPLFMTNTTKNLMVEGYNAMNEALQKVVEQ